MAPAIKSDLAWKQKPFVLPDHFTSSPENTQDRFSEHLQVIRGLQQPVLGLESQGISVLPTTPLSICQTSSLIAGVPQSLPGTHSSMWLQQETPGTPPSQKPHCAFNLSVPQFPHLSNKMSSVPHLMWPEELHCCFVDWLVGFLFCLLESHVAQ